MPDTHIPEPEPTGSQRVGAKVQDLIDSGHEFYATAVTGEPTGRLRRPTLFIIAVIGTTLGTLWFPAALVALIAILALAYTDQVL